METEGVDMDAVDWRATAEVMQGEINRLSYLLAEAQTEGENMHNKYWRLWGVARAVRDSWVDGDGPIPAKRAELRELVAAEGYSGYRLAYALDELAESYE